nr:GNAT family N-acetyltransferase [Deinococcus humi]
MVRVHYRPITSHHLAECLALELDDAQRAFVAPNVLSLAQASVNPDLRPFGVYDDGSLGFEAPVTPMVGFVMLQVTAGVGFVLRLMIDRRFQGRGLARATLREAVRRLRLDPEVRVIATSHRHENQAVGPLLTSEGFVPWPIEYAQGHATETSLPRVGLDGSGHERLRSINFRGRAKTFKATFNRSRTPAQSSPGQYGECRLDALAGGLGRDGKMTGRGLHPGMLRTSTVKSPLTNASAAVNGTFTAAEAIGWAAC